MCVISIGMYVCMYTKYMYECMYVCLYICFICLYVCLYVFIYVYFHTDNFHHWLHAIRQIRNNCYTSNNNLWWFDLFLFHFSRNNFVNSISRRVHSCFVFRTIVVQPIYITPSFLLEEHIGSINERNTIVSLKLFNNTTY